MAIVNFNSISGVSTISATSSITVGDTVIKNTSISIGTTDTTGRNAGVSTATGAAIYNTTTNQVEVYTPVGWSVASKPPIIATGGCGGIVQALLEETNAGKFAENSETLKNILMEYYQEFVQFGKVESRSNNNIQNYSYRSVANKYSEVLNSLVKIIL